jgi:hypothetical protein
MFSLPYDVIDLSHMLLSFESDSPKFLCQNLTAIMMALVGKLTKIPILMFYGREATER